MAKHKYIETPERMWELFEQYVVDTKKTPKFENILIQKTGDIVQVPRERPISFIGFENWLYKNAIISQLRTYEQNDNDSYKEYLPIITRIKAFIYEDKADGATVGIFNSSIVARELGLSDKSDVETTIKGKLQVTEVSYEQAKEIQKKFDEQVWWTNDT